MKHLIPVSLLLALPAGLLLLACDGPPGIWNPWTVREAPDGDAWFWECTRFRCTPHPTDQIDGIPECPDGWESSAAFYAGRFFAIATTCKPPDGGGHSYLGWTRLAICDDDHDCPNIFHWREYYECVNGLCQNTDSERFPRDVLIRDWALDLCFSALPREQTLHGAMGWEWEDVDPGFEEVMQAVGEICDPAAVYNTPCTGDLPDWCMQP